MGKKKEGESRRGKKSDFRDERKEDRNMWESNKYLNEDINNVVDEIAHTQ